jgi:hypothetical protein
MVWLVAIIVFVVLALVDAWTLRSILRLPSRSPWRFVSVGLLVVGLALGLWLGCSFTYEVAPDWQYVGFPAPGLVLHREGGRWVDYVGLIPVVVPFNVFVVASFALLPFSIGLLIGRSMRSRPKTSGPRVVEQRHDEPDAAAD